MSRAFEQPLYHGTVEMIPRIDVMRGRFKKDFGQGIYGKVGSFEAKNALLNVLEVENLGTQCCLCTEKAVEVGVMTFGPVDWRAFE